MNENICKNNCLFSSYSKRIKKAPEVIIKIDLNNRNITSICSCISRYVNLKTLYLYNNQITKIEGLDGLVNLQELNLYNNQIIKIEGLDGLIKLKKLNLYNNQITKIEGLDGLVNLNILSLSRNRITKIEGLDNLKNLQKLYLNNNQITTIEEIEELSLTHINFENNPSEEISNMNINTLKEYIKEHHFPIFK